MNNMAATLEDRNQFAISRGDEYVRILMSIFFRIGIAWILRVRLRFDFPKYMGPATLVSTMGTSSGRDILVLS